MPVLGPDLYNLKDYEALKKIAAAQQTRSPVVRDSRKTAFDADYATMST